MHRRRRGYRASVMGLLLPLALSGCVQAGAESQPMSAVDPSQYAGPLLGSHQLIDSVYIDNTDERPLVLMAATPTAGYNVTVEQAFVVPLPSPTARDQTSIGGVLRWPRPSDEHNTSFNVLNKKRSLKGFVVPPHSREQWLVTLLLKQTNPAKSMRTEGTTITYRIDDRQYQQQISTALCFFTNQDQRACPEAAADFR